MVLLTFYDFRVSFHSCGHSFNTTLLLGMEVMNRNKMFQFYFWQDAGMDTKGAFDTK